MQVSCPNTLTNAALCSMAGGEFGRTLNQPASVPTLGTKGRPLSLTKGGASASISDWYHTGHGAVPTDHIPSSHVMRGRFCLHLAGECAKAPYQGKSPAYHFDNLDKDFLEDERYEAFGALSAILKLKEQLHVSTERERQLGADLQNALNQIRSIVDSKQQTQAATAELNRLQNVASQLQAQLQQKDGEMRILQDNIDGMDNEMASMRAVIDRQDREIEKSILVTQAATHAARDLDIANARLKGAMEEIQVSTPSRVFISTPSRVVTHSLTHESCLLHLPLLS
jgi:hypothetical protein